MSDTYRTIESSSEGLYKDKGSRFLAFAYPLASEEEVKPLVDALKSRYYDARHHCYAWRLGLDETCFRANDDGEPSGTAGRPILGQLLSRGVTNLIVVVVRYFGGIKLGVPGLIAAYKSAAAAALEEAVVVERQVKHSVKIEFPYLAMNAVMKIVKETAPDIVRQQFDNLCSMRLEIRRAQAEELTRRLGEVEGLTILNTLTD